MSIKFSSYVNQIQFFICQSSPVVNQIQFFVHMSIKIDFCFYSFLLRGRARLIISFLMFCLLAQTKTNMSKQQPQVNLWLLFAHIKLLPSFGL